MGDSAGSWTAESASTTGPPSTSFMSDGEVPLGHVNDTAGVGLWIGFSILVAGALGLDLVSQSSADQKSSMSAQTSHVRQAAWSSLGWLSLGFSFAAFLGCMHGYDTGMVFLTGYLVEKSLSVDNLVVILLIFRSFKIPPALQGRVLKWGILGAIFFRTIFIFAGIALLECFSWTVYLFGVILLYSAYKMWTDEDEEDEDLLTNYRSEKSWYMRLIQIFMPYHDAQVTSINFVQMIGGKMHATPMLAALVVVELSDVLFAVDSIPCILGLTHDIFLVFSSNMLAILGLRSLYLLLVEVLDRFKYLKAGLAIILGYVGVKMMAGHHFPIPHNYSLLVIFGILLATLAIGGLTPPDSKHLQVLPVDVMSHHSV